MKHEQTAILKRILCELKSYQWYLGGAIFLGVITVITTLRIPVLTGQGVDCIHSIHQVDFEGLIYVLQQMAVMIVLTCISQWGMTRCNYYVTYHFAAELRNKAFGNMSRLPVKTIVNHGQGDYISRIGGDIDVVADGLLMGFSQLFTGVLTICGTLFFMFSIDVPITMLVVLLTPVSLFVARFIARRTYHLFQMQAKARGQQTTYMEEMVDNQDLIWLFQNKAQVEQKFLSQNQDLYEKSLKATFYSSITNPSTRFVNGLVYAGVGIFGALQCIQGGFSVGGLTSFLGYASSYTKPFNEISGVVTELQNAIACGKRVFELIDEVSEEEATELEELSVSEVKGKVELQNVYFSYQEGEPFVQNMNLSVAPGQRIAIVGPTGSGKTTLIQLLMRFYEVDQGKILIDDKDITEISKENLRKLFGMVLQETWIREGTIADNLCMNRKDITKEEMIAAAKQTKAHDFIKRLPEGYDTYLKGEGGSLSQGQKQLLCITRIMLDIPPMLILDEATSSIDTRTEQKIQKAFSYMMKGRTTFVVAHRLSTIKEADVILYMEKGNIVEMGNHKELLEKEGKYAALYRSQFLITP